MIPRILVNGLSKESKRIADRVVDEIFEQMRIARKRWWPRTKDSFTYKVPDDVSAFMLDYLEALFDLENIKLERDARMETVRVSGYY